LLALLCLSHVALADESVDIATADGEEKKSAVKVLDVSNFERLTQAASGATTGDWFVEFYAPWCGHCKTLEPMWEEVAEKMLDKRQSGERSAIIAKVDVTANTYLLTRFKVAGFPTLIMFSQGMQYQFKGERDVEKLLDFAMGGFKEVTGIEVMKGINEMNPVEKLQHYWKVALHDDMKQIWRLHKAAFFLFVAVAFVLGVLIGRMTVPRAPASSSKKNN